MAVPAPLMAYVVFRRLIRSDSKTSGCETLANQISDFAFSLAALLVGVTGYVSLIVIGSTFSEVRIPALVLGGLWNLMQIATDDAAEGLGRGIGKYLAAGLMLGAAVGFKVTNVPFAVGCGAGILVLLVRGKGSWRGLGAYVIGGVAASFATGGWWLLKVFREYGDPVYPLLARALGSP